jgi:hypothetical protein
MPLFEHELRVRLRERRNRLYKTDFRTWPNEAGMMLGWMRSEPYLAALLAEIESAPIDPEVWKEAGGLSWNNVSFPEDERERAKVCLALFEAKDVQSSGYAFGADGDFNDMARTFVSGVVDVLVNYLEDRIEDGGSVLGILERYKRRTEWFHQRDLHQLYERDTQHGEQLLDEHLREYLVDQGIDFPFSQAAGPSGEADVVALGGDAPLALEIKLFLPDASKDRAYIRQGFSQAYKYASDYGLPAGYLVVYNLTDGLLVFGTDHPGRWPASVAIGDRTVFCLVVNANPDRPSASREQELNRYELDREYLLAGVQAG